MAPVGFFSAICGPRGQVAEKRVMAKTVIAIAGIGGAGCLLLSFCMQEALDALLRHERHPVELALERRFVGQLAAPAQFEGTMRPDGRAAVVRLTVSGNPPKDPLAEVAGAIAWNLLRGTAGEPAALTVVIADDVGSPTRAWQVPLPSPPR